MNITITATHDREGALKDSTHMWNFLWKKKVTSYWTTLAFFVVMFLFGFVLKSSEPMKYFWFGFSSLGIGLYALSLVDLRRTKINHFKSVELLNSKYNEINNETTFVFTDETFSYKDFRFEVSIIWSELSRYFVIDNTVHMLFEKAVGVVFSLDETDAGAENYKNILALIRSKDAANKSYIQK